MTTANKKPRAKKPPTGLTTIENNINKSINKPYKKLDLSKAIKLYFDNGVCEADIARHFNVSPARINTALKPFKELMKDSETLRAFREHKTDLLASAELELLKNIVDKDKAEKASLNNVAYAYTAIHNAGRLESGLSTSNIQLQSVSLDRYKTEIDITPDSSEL
jgi:hypothetical protein